MRNEDGFASTSTSPDPEWSAKHPALDAALVTAIRAPAADPEFDRQVWARIRAEAGTSAPTVQRQQRFGAPVWLNALNVIAIGVVIVLVALALGTAAQPARVAVALVEHSQNLTRMAVLMVSGAALWLGLRRTPWARTIGL